jgi:hypothetical protein
MATYTPEQTAVWTLAQWNELAGRRISLTVDGCWHEQDRMVGQVEFSGSPHGPDRMVTVEWAGSGSISLVREFGAEITVLD